MRRRFLLLVACLSCSLSAALAQSQPSPTYFLRHSASAPHLGLMPLPASPAPTVAPLPPVQAAAVVATPLPAATSLSSAAERPMGLDLTGNRAYPATENQSEAYLKHTRTALTTEPLPVQMLRGVLGR